MGCLPHMVLHQRSCQTVEQQFQPDSSGGEGLPAHYTLTPRGRARAARSRMNSGPTGRRTPHRPSFRAIGIRGSKVGIQKQDLTLAEVLKSQAHATPNSARTTWGTGMSFCRPFMLSTHRLATSITSTPKRNPKSSIAPARRPRPRKRSLRRVVASAPGRPTRALERVQGVVEAAECLHP
jgi:hypothetical protein